MVQVVTILEEVVSGSDRHHFLQRYHEYARVGVKLPLRELYFDHNKNLWAPQTCAYATLRRGKFDVSQCFFQFCYRYLEI